MFQIFKEHKGFGKQIFLLAKNELIKTYKGAVIGPFWAVIKPAFTLFVYWFAFSVGIRSAGNVEVIINGEFIANFDRFIFMLVGFIPWFFISESITQGAKSIRINRQFVTKVSFPVSTIMTYTSVARLFVHLFLFVIMYVYVAFAHGVSIYNLQFFLYCPLMFAFFVALSWSTAPMSAFSADFENMIISIMSGIFWLSGIIYNSYNMEVDLLVFGKPLKPILEFAMMLNPINFFANGYRNAFLYDRWFFEYPLELIIFLVEFVLVVALGIYNYNRLRKTLPDVL
ncbi:MAG: ABC transporter permease [Ruminococcus sp.]|nr:ABC transporter permease [Ruminococcus sp.]